MKKKGLALAAASALLVVGVVAGSLAWLTDSTEEVKNTFTTSNIDVTLTEDAGGEDKQFKMVPGYTITKDPKATVKAGSEECYLFVKIVKSTNFDDFMTYEVADGWTQLTKDKDNNDITDLVYYREIKNSGSVLNADQEFAILKDNKVTVKGSVTKSDMEKIDGVDSNGKTDTEAARNEIAARPTLTFTAYASQLYKNNTEKFSVAEAWANISNPTGATTTP